MTDHPETYLGDGVYASHDGYQVWLRTRREDGFDHRIALEPPVAAALMSYIRDARDREDVIDGAREMTAPATAARLVGREAFLEGVGASDNPYSQADEPDLRRAWDEGYSDAFMDQPRERED